MISLKERGGCVTGCRKSEIIEPTKMAITNILDEIVCSNVSKDSVFISGTNS
jgi:hypothetical protein